MAAMPPGSALALVSDHGFERVNTMVNLRPLAEETGVTNLIPMGGMLVAGDEAGAAFVRKLQADAKSGVGREIRGKSCAAFLRRSPLQRSVVFEPAPGFMFSGRGDVSSEVFSKPAEIGNHGFWPCVTAPCMCSGEPALSVARCPRSR